MKKKIFQSLTILLLPVVSHAWNEASSMKLFADEGRFTFSPSLNTSLSNKANTADGTGGRAISTETFKGYNLGLEAEYGFMKNFAFRAETSFDFFQYYNSAPTSGTKTRVNKAGGFNDPSITLRNRMINGEWTMDWFFQWESELKMKTLSTSTNTGNAYYIDRTGQTFNFGTDMTTDVASDLEFGMRPYISLSTGADFDSTSKNLNNGATTTTKLTGSSSFRYGLNAKVRKHIDKLFGQFGLDLNSPKKYEATLNSLEVNSGNTTVITTFKDSKSYRKLPLMLSPSLMFGYKLTDNDAVNMNLQYSSYTFETWSETNNSISPGTKQKVSVKDWALSFGYVKHI